MPNIYLITGATSDVGLLLIQRLLEHAPPDDIIAAQGHSHLSALAELSQQYPGRLRTFSVDLSDAGALPLFLNSVERAAGIPTHFVHLPALGVVGTKFKQFEQERFEKDLQLQLHSAIAICKHFVPLMAKNRFGRVLFLLSSSILGTPPPGTAAYVVAKQALLGLAKSLSADYAAFGVTVNCVAPSMIEAEFPGETPPLAAQAAAEVHPLGRHATPEDVVPAMEFLLGEGAGFITGVVLPITGGA